MTEAPQAVVAGKLATLRSKLLDLTARNPLLSFRHQARSGRFLRVIDEVPDLLHERWEDGSSMRFRSLGPASREPADERELGFRRALDAAKLQDEEYLVALRALSDDAGSKAQAAIEQQLRVRLRARLGMPPRPDQAIPDPAAVAREQGLDPGFDLPMVASGERRHHDQYLQTLLFEEQLQATLTNLRGRVQLSLSESGINPLFAVFGFLEWYEQKEPQKLHSAPLLLHPLAMTRELKQGRYQYEVHSAGEGMQTNVALRARLRAEFGLELPEFDDETTPERFFAAVQAVVVAQPGWRVRRCVTVALLSFAKIAMYNDLAPEHWHGGAALQEHPQLQRLLGGASPSGGAAAGVEHLAAGAAPAPVPRPEALPLVIEADSSQRAAIAEVLAGRSLVIEGPPGTGKSQTITNLIAAALAKGQTVLFLAEKMAALEVVQNRLQKLGLAPFCLELHSTRVGREDVVRQVRSRLDLPATDFAEGLLQATARELATLEQSLTDTVAALAAPAAQLGVSVHDLLWRTANLRRATAEAPAAIDGLGAERASAMTELEVDQVEQVAVRLEQLQRELVTRGGGMAQHPWRGIAHQELGVLQVQDLVRAMQDLVLAAAAAEQLALTVSAATRAKLATWAELEQILAARTLDAGMPTAGFALVPALAAPLQFGVLRQFAEDVQQVRELGQRLAARFLRPEAIDSAAPKLCAELAALVADVAPAAAALTDLAGVGAAAQASAGQLARAGGLLAAAAAQLGSPPPAARSAERGLHGALQAAAGLPRELCERRRTELCAVGAAAVLERAHQSWQALRDQRAALAAEFVLTALPEPAVLREHAATMRQPPALRWLRASWRAAWAALGRLALKPLQLDRYAAAARLESLAAFAEGVRALAADAEVQRLAGPGSAGLDGDLPAAWAVARWADAVRAAVPDEALAAAVLVAPTPRLLEVARLAASADAASLASALATDHQSLAVQQQRSEQVARGCVRAQALVQQLELAPDTPCVSLAELAAQLAQRQDRRQRADACAVAAAALGSAFAGSRTELGDLNAAIAYVEAVQALGLPAAVQQWLLQAADAGALVRLQQFAAEVDAAATRLTAVLDRLSAIRPVRWPDWLHTSDPRAATLADLHQAAARAAAAPESLAQLVELLQRQVELRAHGLAGLVELATAEPALQDLGNLARRIVYQSVVRQVLAAAPCLAGFAGARHDDRRIQFAQLDRKLAELLQKQLCATLSRRAAPAGRAQGPKSTWTDGALLRNEAAKEKRFVAVRDLVARAGSALQQLMPCFLMSPLSIAQFLPQQGFEFDLVVMDEASQLRPQEALGGIARGKQVVVVGDPKQLPPTPFFTGGAPDGGDEDDAETDAPEESILDAAAAVLQKRRLTWHYRSRHPSLIEFSNRHFYGSQLVAFPAPYDRHAAFGVRYVHVADGVYGQSLNVPEARQVAEAARRFAVEHPDRSLGVVALNAAQANLLALELDRIGAEDPEFEAWRKHREGTLEPFFVKNLENVQGDERDVIFISTVYGRDAQGVMYQRFGPINGQGGHRRLNVLFTRAKYQVVVFSSMQPGDVVVTEQSSEGVQALRGYLEYARDGWSAAAVPTGRGPESPFEVAVGAVLAEAGFVAVPQVGVAGYRIDLAVRHPERPGEFALGIECDGRMYHSAQSARDRDRLRQEILVRLGWRIHRIWSVDWFAQPQRERERLLAAVRAAVGAAARSGP
jgi:very-short-patch-repair endonuclease